MVQNCKSDDILWLYEYLQALFVIGSLHLFILCTSRSRHYSFVISVLSVKCPESHLSSFRDQCANASPFVILTTSSNCSFFTNDLPNTAHTVVNKRFNINFFQVSPAQRFPSEQRYAHPTTLNFTSQHCSLSISLSKHNRISVWCNSHHLLQLEVTGNIKVGDCCHSGDAVASRLFQISWKLQILGVTWAKSTFYLSRNFKLCTEMSIASSGINEWRDDLRDSLMNYSDSYAWALLRQHSRKCYVRTLLHYHDCLVRKAWPHSLTLITLAMAILSCGAPRATRDYLLFRLESVQSHPCCSYVK
jgi:hypothetical protein